MPLCPPPFHHEALKLLRRSPCAAVTFCGFTPWLCLLLPHNWGSAPQAASPIPVHLRGGTRCLLQGLNRAAFEQKSSKSPVVAALCSCPNLPLPSRLCPSSELSSRNGKLQLSSIRVPGRLRRRAASRVWKV